MGDWFNLIASADLVTELTNSDLAVSYFFLLRFLPAFIFSPIAGVLADRFDRRRLMILSDLLRAVTVLGFLLVREGEQLWLLYLLTVIQFMLSALFVPSRSAALATFVDREDLVTANALDSLTWSTMLALGSLAGGIVAGIFGRTTAFVIDALTFLLSAYFIGRITQPILAQDTSGKQRDNTRFIDGLRYLGSVPIILIISLLKMGGTLAWGAINVLEISYAKELFPIGTGGNISLGLIYAVSGIGTGMGPIIVRKWAGNKASRLRWGIAIGFVLLSGGITLLSTALTFNWFLGWTLMRTAGSGIIWVFSAALLQMFVPDRVRGRVFAFEYATFTLAQVISILWAGMGQEKLGLSLRQVTFSVGIVGAIVGAVWLGLHLWELRARKRDGSQLNQVG